MKYQGRMRRVLFALALFMGAAGWGRVIDAWYGRGLADVCRRAWNYNWAEGAAVCKPLKASGRAIAVDREIFDSCPSCYWGAWY